ncbi:MAG: helix-turn-helix transcriptional regulator [Chloroflexi bacterium]|nr:helix-turn-helix transcriptional regulator [Chloroflexota bacterium]
MKRLERSASLWWSGYGGREAGQGERWGVQTRSPGERPRLTALEGQVLSLLWDGLTNEEIAERLYLSPNTVREYVSRLLEKYGVSNRTALAGCWKKGCPEGRSPFGGGPDLSGYNFYPLPGQEGGWSKEFFITLLVPKSTARCLFPDKPTRLKCSMMAELPGMFR